MKTITILHSNGAQAGIPSSYTSSILGGSTGGPSITTRSTRRSCARPLLSMSQELDGAAQHARVTPFRFITKSIHAYLIDYPVAIVLMVAPFLLKLGKSRPVALCFRW